MRNRISLPAVGTAEADLEHDAAIQRLVDAVAAERRQEAAHRDANKINGTREGVDNPEGEC